MVITIRIGTLANAILALTGTLLCGCGHATLAKQTEPGREFARQLEACPLWTGLDLQDRSGKDELFKSLDRLANFDASTILEGIKLYLAAHENGPTVVEAWQKVFVLNRFVINVPEHAGINTAYFGGWTGIPTNSQGMNLLWPLQMTGARFDLIATSIGFFGPDYRGAEEFDFLKGMFGMRKRPPNPAGRNG